jgi:hypothetical protein
MKWIVVAIILVVVPYTFLTLYFRKPSEPFRPYEDMKNRANVVRLLAAGYQRIPLAAQRPADPSGARPTPTSAAAGGLPAELAATLVEPTLLPAEIVSVAAAGSVASGASYDIRFSCKIPDEQQQLGGAELYVKDSDLIIVPVYERLKGRLTARTRDHVVLITVPAGALKAGSYRVTLVAQRSSRTWPLSVK